MKRCATSIHTFLSYGEGGNRRVGAMNGNNKPYSHQSSNHSISHPPLQLVRRLVRFTLIGGGGGVTTSPHPYSYLRETINNTEEYECMAYQRLLNRYFIYIHAAEPVCFARHVLGYIQQWWWWYSSCHWDDGWWS